MKHIIAKINNRPLSNIIGHLIIQCINANPKNQKLYNVHYNRILHYAYIDIINEPEYINYLLSNGLCTINERYYKPNVIWTRLILTPHILLELI
jgi:hypothetical protein